MSFLKQIREKMAAAELPALIISDIGNVQWATGFTGSFGFVLLTPTDGRFITDSRYTVQARDQVQNLTVSSFGTPKTLVDVLAEEARSLGIAKLGFETSMSYSQWDSWRTKLDGFELVPAGDVLTQLRMIKTPEEVAKIGAACKLADQCFQHVLRLIQPGVSEYDIGLEIEFFFRRNGAKIGFEPIVASGPNSAKPHARPTERKLAVGDFVTLDFGAELDGYNSDITRTMVLGKASERQRQIYCRVLEAEEASIAACKPGANGKELDGLAREILDKDDLAQYFGHSLGHGLGRSVHDYGRLSVTTDQPIVEGQVWTIEPGVYIEGYGGVRIEDDVVVTRDGCTVLTSSTKELLEL